MPDPKPEVSAEERTKADAQAGVEFSLRTAVANFHLRGQASEEERIRWMESALNTLRSAQRAAYRRGWEDRGEKDCDELVSWGYAVGADKIRALEPED